MNLIDLLNIIDKFPGNKAYSLYSDNVYDELQFLASTTDGKKHVFNDWLDTKVSGFEIISEGEMIDITIFI